MSDTPQQKRLIAEGRIFDDIYRERRRQDAKFGPIRGMDLAEWTCVLIEEIGEVDEAMAEYMLAIMVNVLTATGGRVGQAVHETIGERTTAVRHGRDAIRKELVQVAAVAVNAIYHLDVGLDAQD